MGKRFLILIVSVLLVFSLMVTPAFTQSYSRMITAWFNNLQVEVDGTLVNLQNEPFIFNNEVYVPIRELSDHVYINFQHDPQSRKITLRSNRDSDNIVNNYQNHFEVYDLRTQIAELEREIQLLKNSNFPYQKITSVEEMENYLREHFRRLGDIPLTIRFRHIGGYRYEFSAVFTSNDVTRWNNLNRRDIENYVDDVFDVVRELFNSKAEIQGHFRSNNFFNGTSYANYWTRGNRLYYDFRLAEHKQNQMVDGVNIEKALTQRLRFYNNATFTYEVFVNQRDIDVIVSFNQNFRNWTPATKMQYLKRLKTEIERVYTGLNVNGRIVNGVSNNNDFRFSFEGDRIRSVDLLNELESHLNNNYKTFTYGGTSHTFTYRVNEGYSGSFEVTLEGNFDENSQAWSNVKQYGEASFRSFILRAFQHIDSIFDVDIFGNVVDKNLYRTTTLEYYKLPNYTTRTLQPIIFE